MRIECSFRHTIFPVGRCAAAMVAVAARGVAHEADGCGRRRAREPAASWARTVTGAIESVRPARFVTPVHPEAIAHPGGDAMGGSQLTKELTAADRADDRPLVARAGEGLDRRAESETRPDSSIPQLPGIDVSTYQGAINWASVAPHVDFVLREGDRGHVLHRTRTSTNQYDGPYDYGVIRGAYHFAIPNNSTGTAQADYFIAHGGGWSADGKTLPGALDIEYNPYGASATA